MEVSDLKAAKILVKLELIRKKIKISHVKPQEITDEAKTLIKADPEYVATVARMLNRHI